MTALMLASEIGDSKSVAHLLQGGANVNLKNQDDYTALILASSCGHAEVCRLLCQNKGTIIDDKNKFGKSALIMAAEFGKLESVKTLLDFGADIDCCSDRGLSSLMLSSVKGMASTFSLLMFVNSANAFDYFYHRTPNLVRNITSVALSIQTSVILRSY
jgi:serine/threonine-protein phosphatase 6 regulatory ankyrin repeat subunit B